MKLSRRGFLRLSRDAGVTAAALGVCALEMQNRGRVAAPPPVKRMTATMHVWAGNDNEAIVSKAFTQALQEAANELQNQRLDNMYLTMKKNT